MPHAHPSRILGIHHVTAIAGDPPVNLDFYTRVLGLRLVKRTVNFDDPSTWHLYYGDRLGLPGTLLTFFPYLRARAGRRGSSEIARTDFAIALGTRDRWRQHLEAEGVTVERTDTPAQPALVFNDPHGMRLAMIETDASPVADVEPWSQSDVPAEMAIRGFAGAHLRVRDLDATATFLAEVLALRQLERADAWCVFAAGEGSSQRIAVAASNDGPDDAPAQFGAGSVHHIAFRVADDAAQQAMRQRLIEARVAVSEIKQRHYFKSIYFHEPGGVIFEIATDGPGNTVDEAESALGASLKLPPWLEPKRAEIERALPPLTHKA